MSKKTDEEKFMDDLYNDANEELKKVYKEQKDYRSNILKEIAQVILSYNVLDLFMNINNSSKKKLHNKFTNLIVSGIKSVAKKEIGVLNNVLESTVKKTFKFYSYNSNLKDVRKIIDSNFKEKKFSERVWDNQEEVAKRLEFQIKRFLDGKINVNQIKRDIEKTFNANAYNSKRLVETEVARASSKAFDRFCKETGVKKVKYNATLDSNICQHCSNDHGKVFNLKDKIETPRHPLCRCFYTIEDDNYEVKSKVDDEIAVSKDDDNDIINDEDAEEYTIFKNALGKEAPKTFKDFQEIKYNNTKEWEQLKYKYQKFKDKDLVIFTEDLPIPPDRKKHVWLGENKFGNPKMPEKGGG